MSDLVNQLETLVHNWANPNDAKSKIEELVKKFKTSPNTQNRINPDEILKVHPTGGRVEEGYGFEIALVYSKSGAATAAKLKPYLEHDLMMGLFFDFEATQDFDAELLEKNICNTLLTVVLLTKDTLKEPSVIFAMETLLHPEYHEKAKCVLVHDASSCFFPSGDEQASSIKHLFAEKAVTLLPEYITVAVDDILGRLEEIETKEILSEEGGKEQEVMTSTAHNHSLTKMTPYPSFICNGCKGTFEGEHFHCVLCQFDLCDECAEKTRESIETDCFLSHKRTTAQVIAGRLYEGLKTDYKVFLDSEAKFKIHDLEKIVEQTGLFVLILSAGYLDSYWCCQELRSALKFGRKTLVVRDLNYHLPPRESLPDSFNDIKAALYDSPTIPWVAEYNGACLSTIRRKFLGPPKKVLEEFGVWWGANEAELGKISEETGYFKLSSWEGKVNHVFEAFDVHAPGTNEEITAVDLSESELEDEEVIGLEQLPKLEKLNIASCVMGGSIKHLGRAAPKLASLDISRNALNDLMFMGMIRKLGSLTELDVSYCWNLTDVALHQIATKCKKLATIKVVGCNFSEEGFRGFQETLPNCQIIQE